MNVFQHAFPFYWNTFFRREHYSQTQKNHDRDGVGYLILISIDFLRLYFSVFSLVLTSIEKTYETRKTVLEHISKPPICRQKYPATRFIFNSLLGVWKYD